MCFGILIFYIYSIFSSSSSSPPLNASYFILSLCCFFFGKSWRFRVVVDDVSCIENYCQTTFFIISLHLIFLISLGIFFLLKSTEEKNTLECRAAWLLYFFFALRHSRIIFSVSRMSGDQNNLKFPQILAFFMLHVNDQQ